MFLWILFYTHNIEISWATNRENNKKKKGRKVPGHMCAGCKENGMVLNAKEVEPVPMEED